MIAFLKFLQFCFRIIFCAPAGVALFLMYLAGWKAQVIAKRTKLKRIVAENIKLVFPESKADRIAERLIENTSYALFEILCLPFFKAQHYQRILKLKGLENINQALKEGKGAIILTLHAGNYELIPLALANLGYSLNTVLRAPEDPIFEIVNQSRRAGGVKTINILEEDMYKESLKVLNKNELIYLLADTGALESRHAYLKFLEKEVPVATGWLALAERSESAVIPALAKKQGRENNLSFLEPIKITRENREEVMQKVGGIFESFLKQNPEQWAMFLNPYETQRMIQGK